MSADTTTYIPHQRVQNCDLFGTEEDRRLTEIDRRRQEGEKIAAAKLAKEEAMRKALAEYYRLCEEGDIAALAEELHDIYAGDGPEIELVIAAKALGEPPVILDPEGTLAVVREEQGAEEALRWERALRLDKAGAEQVARALIGLAWVERLARSPFPELTVEQIDELRWVARGKVPALLAQLGCGEIENPVERWEVRGWYSGNLYCSTEDVEEARRDAEDATNRMGERYYIRPILKEAGK